MAQTLSPEISTHRLTRLGAAVEKILQESTKPVISPGSLFDIVRGIYRERPQGLYLRSDSPGEADLSRLRQNLIKCRIIRQDPDYKRRAYRILSNPDAPAEAICCIIDPYCYVSHISAMQRYGLTERRPQALHISRVLTAGLKEENEKLGQKNPSPTTEWKRVNHPKTVRDRKLYVYATHHQGHWVNVRGTDIRVSTIGQTFLDTLIDPALCGGMAHVMDVWAKHAKKFLDEIISSIDNTEVLVVKVRAGYLLEEILKLKDKRIEKWLAHAQRGGSRKLDPHKEYGSIYSERWMLAINA